MMIQVFLLLAGAVSILTTVGIVFELGKESLLFFQTPRRGPNTRHRVVAAAREGIAAQNTPYAKQAAFPRAINEHLFLLNSSGSIPYHARYYNHHGNTSSNYHYGAHGPPLEMLFRAHYKRFFGDIQPFVVTS